MEEGNRNVVVVEENNRNVVTVVVVGEKIEMLWRGGGGKTLEMW